jgi:hypothetical protein
VEQEPAMTERMITAIEKALDGEVIRGVRWEAKTLTDRGKGTQEKRYGADFLGALNIDLPDYKVAKGFLAQAKLLKHETVDDLSGLKEQCKKMLKLSPDSFVFLYSKTGVRVVPAISVIASDRDPTELYGRSVQRFFEEHIECFIGDRAIQAATPGTLEDLRHRYEARDALLLTARLV